MLLLVCPGWIRQVFVKRVRLTIRAARSKRCGYCPLGGLACVLRNRFFCNKERNPNESNQEDFTQNGHCSDLIIVANGYPPISDYRHVLTPTGTHVMGGGPAAQMFEAMLQGPWISMTRSKKMGNLLAKPNKKDLAFMKELLEAGKVKAFIDRYYPLSEVADALRYFEEGHAQGKVVIRVAQNN